MFIPAICTSLERVGLVGLLWLASTVANAQVFKCAVAGKQVYQQHPCEQAGGTGEKMRVQNEQVGGGYAKISASVPEDGKEICIKAAPNVALWKDKESLRIGTTTRLGAETIIVADKYVKVHTYAMSINAKNSYGGYTGDKVHLCYVDVTERSFVSFRSFQ